MSKKKIEDFFPSGKLRDGHPYYMHDEIRATAKCLKACLAEDLLNQQRSFSAKLHPKNVFLVGCGTSYNVALALAYAVRNMLKLPAIAMDGLDFDLEPPPDLNESSLVISISHTGQSLATCLAQDRAREYGASTVSITGLASSRLATSAHFSITDPHGKEAPFGKTRSYLSCVFQGLLFLSFLAQESYRQALLDETGDLPSVLDNHITEWDKQSDLIGSEWAKTVSRYLLGGYGIQAPNAVEIALKILEVTGESAVGYGLEEFSHGPCASLRENVGVMMLQSGTVALSRAVEVATAVASTKASMIIITDQLDAAWPEKTPIIAVSGFSNGLLDLFPSAIVAQLVQYYLALHKGFNTDINNRDLPELANLSGLLFPPGTH